MDSQVLFVSYSLVTKRVSAHPWVRRSPAPTSAKASAGRQSPRWLVPWIPRLRLRDRLSTIQQNEGIEVRAVHPSTHFVGGQSVPFGERRYLSRGPDQHPLGGDTAALLVAAPAQSIPGQALPQGSITWATADGFNNHENNPVTSHPPKTTKSRYSKSEK